MAPPCDPGISCQLQQFRAVDLPIMQRLGITPALFALHTLALVWIAWLPAMAVGLLLWLRGRKHPVALLGAYGMLGLALAQLVDAGGAPLPLLITKLLYAPGQALLHIFLLAFPTGRILPRWARFVVGLEFVFAMLAVWPDLNPLAKPELEWLGFVLFLTFSALPIMALFLRYRGSTSQQRKQLKLAIFGIVVSYCVFLGSLGVGALVATHWSGWNLISQMIVLQLSWLSSAVIPVVFGIAILRDKLFDIDIIIRKTLQWTLVTLLSGAVYVGTVLGLQEVFKRLTGQTSEVAVALSTLALAVAFMPIRRAAQNMIDKRFYRRRYNAEQVIEAYAASIKDEVDTAVIHQKMLAVLGDTLQPKKIVLFLAQPHPHPRFAPLPKRERE